MVNDPQPILYFLGVYCFTSMHTPGTPVDLRIITDKCRALCKQVLGKLTNDPPSQGSLATFTSSEVCVLTIIGARAWASGAWDEAVFLEWSPKYPEVPVEVAREFLNGMYRFSIR
jgi:hypothetical protein